MSCWYKYRTPSPSPERFNIDRVSTPRRVVRFRKPEIDSRHTYTGPETNSDSDSDTDTNSTISIERPPPAIESLEPSMYPRGRGGGSRSRGSESSSERAWSSTGAAFTGHPPSSQPPPYSQAQSQSHEYAHSHSHSHSHSHPHPGSPHPRACVCICFPPCSQDRYTCVKTTTTYECSSYTRAGPGLRNGCGYGPGHDHGLNPPSCPWPWSRSCLCESQWDCQCSCQDDGPMMSGGRGTATATATAGPGGYAQAIGHASPQGQAQSQSQYLYREFGFSHTTQGCGGGCGQPVNFSVLNGGSCQCFCRDRYAFGPPLPRCFR